MLSTRCLSDERARRRRGAVNAWLNPIASGDTLVVSTRDVSDNPESFA
jgi:hypothetical protein